MSISAFLLTKDSGGAIAGSGGSEQLFEHIDTKCAKRGEVTIDNACTSELFKLGVSCRVKDAKG